MADQYHFLKVGCGDCSIMKLDSKIVMVDCHQGDVRNGEENILDYLPDNKINLLILTHQHYEHFDGIQTLLDNDVKVMEIWESPYERKPEDNSVSHEEWQDYQKLVGQLVDKGTLRFCLIRSTKAYDVVGGARFQILNPPRDINTGNTRELHDGCLVISVMKGKQSILFTGDASDRVLEEIMIYDNLLKADILHASHHGSLDGACLEFIKSINPHYTIISTKSGVHSDIPHPTALQRYQTYTRKVVKRTDIDSTITISDINQ